MQTGHGSKDAEMSGAFHGIKMKRRIGGVPRHCLQGVQIAWALRPFEHKNRIVKITRPKSSWAKSEVPQTLAGVHIPFSVPGENLRKLAKLNRPFNFLALTENQSSLYLPSNDPSLKFPNVKTLHNQSLKGGSPHVSSSESKSISEQSNLNCKTVTDHHWRSTSTCHSGYYMRTSRLCHRNGRQRLESYGFRRAVVAVHG